MLLLNSVAYAAGNAAIQQLKETQRLDKSNPYGKNGFKSFIKNLIEENLIKKLPDISKIETFINDVSAGALSLYNVPGLSKYLANKIKQSVVDGVIAPMRGDELIQKLKNIQRPHSPAGKFDPVNQCTGCDGCDLEKFIETNLVKNFDACVPEIDRLMKWVLLIYLCILMARTGIMHVVEML